MRATKVIWLSGTLSVEQRHHAAMALFESGLADWETARLAAERTPGILFMSDDPGKIEAVVRRLREADIHSQVTEREAAPEGGLTDAGRRAAGLIEILPEPLQRAVGDHLAEGESVEASLHYGSHALVVTNTRVLLVRSSVLASARPPFGAQVRSFPFAQITSVDVRMGWVGGQVRLTARGSLESRDDRISHLEEQVFVFQEERLKPFASSAVELIRSRLKRGQKDLHREEADLTSRPS